MRLSMTNIGQPIVLARLGASQFLETLGRFWLRLSNYAGKCGMNPSSQKEPELRIRMNLAITYALP